MTICVNLIYLEEMIAEKYKITGIAYADTVYYEIHT